jgi:hypothetical protein
MKVPIRARMRMEERFDPTPILSDPGYLHVTIRFTADSILVKTVREGVLGYDFTVQ